MIAPDEMPRNSAERSNTTEVSVMTIVTVRTINFFWKKMPNNATPDRPSKPTPRKIRPQIEPGTQLSSASSGQAWWQAGVRHKPKSAAEDRKKRKKRRAPLVFFDSYLVGLNCTVDAEAEIDERQQRECAVEGHADDLLDADPVAFFVD